MRKIIFWAHLSTGILIGTVVFVMALSGALMAFEPQILEFAERRINHVQVPPAAVKLSLAELALKAGVKNPGAKITGMVLQNKPEAALMVQFGKDKPAIFVDPYTGKVLGKQSRVRTFLHDVENFHVTLSRGETGEKITAFCAFALFFLVLGGIYLWWPWKTMKFKPGLSGKARNFNLHNTIGFWCLPMLLVTTSTGMIMAYPWANNLLYKLTRSEMPAKPQAGKAAAGAVFNPDQVLESVEKNVPGWKSASIRYPKEGTAAVSVYLVEAGAKRDFQKSLLTVNSGTGEVIKWEPYSSYNAGRKLRTWTKYLHTGESFGLITQLIAFISALGAMMLVWTGFSMAIFRLKKIIK